MKLLIKLFSIVLCLCLCVVLLSSCGFTQDDLDEARRSGYDSGYNQGRDNGYDNGYKDGYDDGYDFGYDFGYSQGLTALKPVTLPETGTILSGSEYYDSEITVNADGSSSYVVSLKNLYGEERVSFFVRAGETAVIGVPSEHLYVYFASGSTWYGYGEGLMFGEETIYSKDDKALDFAEYTWEYTLYPVYNGNFSETPSNADEFFG